MMNSRLDRLVWALDWNLLRTFVVIVEEKSITRAAERLPVSGGAPTAAGR
jgi:DNA-binding transcriptional LysR family regulator